MGNYLAGDCVGASIATARAAREVATLLALPEVSGAHANNAIPSAFGDCDVAALWQHRTNSKSGGGSAEITEVECNDRLRLPVYCSFEHHFVT